MRCAALLVVVLAIAPAAAALLPPLSEAAPAAAVVAPEHLWIPSFDGTRLRATWFLPEGPGPFPVVLRTHGWAQQRDVAPTPTITALLERNYAVLTWDSRGFGESEGLVELNSPDFEVRDVRALLDWVAARPDVAFEVPGDPKVGMSGVSYAGGIQLLAGAFDPRLDALAPEITWNDLRHSLGPNGVLKTGWVALLYGAGLVSGYTGTYDPQKPDRFYPNSEGMDPLVTRWLGESLAENRLSSAAEEALAQRSIATYLDAVEDFPPTMLYQGWRDTLFTPNEAVWTFEKLRERGFKTCLLLHGGGHGYETPGEDHVRESLLDFLDYYILETTAPIPPPIEVYRPWDGTWQTIGSWPDASGATLPLRPGAVPAPGGRVLIPATIAPAGFREVPNFQEDLPVRAFDAPLAAATFLQAPFATDTDLLGTPRARLSFVGPVPEATVFVKVVDVAPDGTRVVVGNQVTPVRIEAPGTYPGDPVVVDLELTSIAHRFAAGHSFGLAISASDTGHASARNPLPLTLNADGSSTVTLP